jgi:mannosyltransferase
MLKSRARSSERIVHAVLLLILLLALILRVHRLDGQSLWADEGNSTAMAGRTWAQIADASALDIHPPLYYWALKAWTGLLGTTEVGLRSLSALLGIVVVWLTYQIGRLVSGRLVALLAAFLASISPLQVYYAQETRMYMLLAACGAGLFWGLLRLIRHQGQDASRAACIKAPCSLAIVLSTVVGLYTHYSFPVLVATVNLLYAGWWIASARRRPAWKHLAWWAALQVVSLLAFLPWLPTAADRVRSWPSVAHPLGWAEGLAAALRLLSLGPECPAGPGSSWLAVFGLLAGVGILCSHRRSSDPKSGISRWLARLTLIAWLAAPVVMMLAFRLFSEAYLKFLLVASVPFCLLLARALVGLAGTVRRLCEWLLDRLHHATQGRIPSMAVRSAGGLLGLLLPTACVAALVVVPEAVALHAYYYAPACARDDYRGIAKYVTTVSAPNDAILLNAPGQLEVWNYYDRSGLSVYPLPEQRPLDVEETVAKLEAIAARHSTLYGLFWATEESDPQRVVESWLDQHTFKASDLWRGHVRFVTYSTPDLAARPAAFSTPGLSFGQKMVLQEARLMQDHAAPGSIVQVLLLWQAESEIDRRYKVTLQLLDDSGQVIAQRDAEPVGESRPTTDWSAGEIITDGHGLFIPWATPPGTYRMVLAVYGQADGQRLRLAGGEDSVVLWEFTVDRPADPPPLYILPMREARSVDFGPVSLIGLDYYPKGQSHAPDTPLRPGDVLHLTLFWRADEQPGVDWSLTLSLAGQAAVVVAPLVGARHPTSHWEQGEIARGEHDLPLPVDLRPGCHQVLMSLSATQVATARDQIRLLTVRVQ